MAQTVQRKKNCIICEVFPFQISVTLPNGDVCDEIVGATDHTDGGELILEQESVTGPRDGDM